MAPSSAHDVDHAEYLDRHGVTAYMKDVVTLLLENRPASPIAFISKYFLTVTQGSSPLLRAYRYIQLTSPQRAAFVDNLVAAYATLDARRGASHVTGADLLRLLRLLCVDCPLDVSVVLLRLLDRMDTEPVSFDEFSAAVRAGLYYDQFFKRAGALFAACDQGGTGTIPRSVLELALRQLHGVAALEPVHVVAIRNEHARNCARPGDPPPAPSADVDVSPSQAAFARSELHRLQREAQWEAAQLGRLAADGTKGSPSSLLSPAANAPPQPSQPPVTLDEFCAELFEASLGAKGASPFFAGGSAAAAAAARGSAATSGPNNHVDGSRKVGQGSRG